jgi:hypothetical protein
MADIAVKAVLSVADLDRRDVNFDHWDWFRLARDVVHF